MGIINKLPTPTIDDLTRQIRFTEANVNQIEALGTTLPAEWFPQSLVQLTWPHEETDWQPILEEAVACYLRMAYEIASRQKLLIVTPDSEALYALLEEKLPLKVCMNIVIVESPTNDTWARDHGFITVLAEDGPHLLDFCFNGWGMKFAADKDNLINRNLFATSLLTGRYSNELDFVLEGGAIESDGQGTLLTTSECLLSPNRNPKYSREEIESRLLHYFQAERVLWLDHGYLAGDDTDSHIDTLARLCPHDTIVYVKCDNPEDEHYEELTKMEEQLKEFRTKAEQPYRLLPLPFPDAIYYTTPDGDTERLPATYANFLIINNAVLMPTYGQPVHDESAKKVLEKAFPHHDIVCIDCQALIKQHGSLHCCTMQFPAGVLPIFDEEEREIEIEIEVEE